MTIVKLRDPTPTVIVPPIATRAATVETKKRAVLARSVAAPIDSYNGKIEAKSPSIVMPLGEAGTRAEKAPSHVKAVAKATCAYLTAEATAERTKGTKDEARATTELAAAKETLAAAVVDLEADVRACDDLLSELEENSAAYAAVKEEQSGAVTALADAKRVLVGDANAEVRTPAKAVQLPTEADLKALVEHYDSLADAYLSGSDSDSPAELAKTEEQIVDIFTAYAAAAESGSPAEKEAALAAMASLDGEVSRRMEQVHVAELDRMPRDDKSHQKDAPDLHDLLVGVRAGMGGEDRPKGVDKTAFDYGRAMKLMGVTDDELTHYIATGEMSQSMKKADLLARGKGEWSAENTLSGVYDIGMAASRARRRRVEVEKKKVDDELAGLGPDASERSTLVSKSAEWAAASKKESSDCKAIEKGKWAMQSAASSARIAGGRQGLVRADDDARKAAELEKKGDIEGATALKAQALKTRETSTKSMLAEGKLLEAQVTARGENAPQGMKDRASAALDGAALGQIALAKKGGEVPAALPPELAGPRTSLFVTTPRSTPEPGKEDGAGYLLARAQAVNPKAIDDPDHLGVAHEYYGAVSDYYDAAAKKEGYASRTDGKPPQVSTAAAAARGSYLYYRELTRGTIDREITASGDPATLRGQKATALASLYQERGEIEVEQAQIAASADLASSQYDAALRGQKDAEEAVAAATQAEGDAEKFEDAAEKARDREHDRMGLTDLLKTSGTVAEERQRLGDAQKALDDAKDATALATKGVEKAKESVTVAGQAVTAYKAERDYAESDLALLKAAQSQTGETHGHVTTAGKAKTSIRQADDDYASAEKLYERGVTTAPKDTARSSAIEAQYAAFEYGYAGYMAQSDQILKSVTPTDPKARPGSVTPKSERAVKADDAIECGDAVTFGLPSGDTRHALVAMGVSAKTQVATTFVLEDPKGAKAMLEDAQTQISEEIAPNDPKLATSLEHQVGVAQLDDVDTLMTHPDEAAKAGDRFELSVVDGLFSDAAVTREDLGHAGDDLGARIDAWQGEFKKMSTLLTTAGTQLQRGADSAKVQSRAMDGESEDLTDDAVSNPVKVAETLGGSWEIAGVNWVFGTHISTSLEESKHKELAEFTASADSRADVETTLFRLGLKQLDDGFTAATQTGNPFEFLLAAHFADVLGKEHIGGSDVYKQADHALQGFMPHEVIERPFAYDGDKVSVDAKVLCFTAIPWRTVLRNASEVPLVATALSGRAGTRPVSQALDLYGDPLQSFPTRASVQAMETHGSALDLARNSTLLKTVKVTNLGCEVILMFAAPSAIAKGLPGLVKGLGTVGRFLGYAGEVSENLPTWSRIVTTGVNAFDKFREAHAVLGGAAHMAIVSGSMMGASYLVRKVFGERSVLSKPFDFLSTMVPFGEAQKLPGMKDLIGLVTMEGVTMFQNYGLPKIFAAAGLENHEYIEGAVSFALGAIVPAGVSAIELGRQTRAALSTIDEMGYSGEEVDGAAAERLLDEAAQKLIAKGMSPDSAYPIAARIFGEKLEAAIGKGGDAEALRRSQAAFTAAAVIDKLSRSKGVPEGAQASLRSILKDAADRAAVGDASFFECYKKLLELTGSDGKPLFSEAEAKKLFWQAVGIGVSRRCAERAPAASVASASAPPAAPIDASPTKAKLEAVDTQPVPADMTIAAGGTELALQLAPLLKGHVIDYNYDSLIFADQFVDALDAHPGVPPEEVFASFRPDSRATTHSDGGSHCVGLGRDLVQLLKDEGITAFVAPAYTPGPDGQPNKEVGHMLAMAKFQNPENAADRGVILLDPGLNLAQPIVVRPGKPTEMTLAGSRWTFTYDESVGSIRASRVRPKDGGMETSLFMVSEVKNPDESLTKSTAIRSDKLKLVTRDDDGKPIAAIVVDLKKRQVTVSVLDVTESVSFDDWSKAKESGFIYDATASLFNSSDTALTERIDKVITHSEDLLRARKALASNPERVASKLVKESAPEPEEDVYGDGVDIIAQIHSDRSKAVPPRLPETAVPKEWEAMAKDINNPAKQAEAQASADRRARDTKSGKAEHETTVATSQDPKKIAAAKKALKHHEPPPAGQTPLEARAQEIDDLNDKIASGMAMPPTSVVDAKRLGLAYYGDPVTGERIPLCFLSPEQFHGFQAGLREILRKYGISDATVQQIGSATTGFAGNPDKPWMKTYTRDSDADFAIFSTQLLVIAEQQGFGVNTNIVIYPDGVYSMYKPRSSKPGTKGFMDTPLGAELEAYASGWDKTLYGDSAKYKSEYTAWQKAGSKGTFKYSDGFDFKLKMTSEPYKAGCNVLVPQLAP